LTTTATVGQTVTEMLLVLFTLIFFLHGSGGIWQFLVRATPSTVRGRVDVAGRSLAVLGRLRSRHRGGGRGPVDAVGIGIGLVVLGGRSRCRWARWSFSAPSSPSSVRSRCCSS
jgi:putative heme transporter